MHDSLRSRIASALLALAGCGGGAEHRRRIPVDQRPDAGPTYSGPAPATADIQAFRINFWENIRGDQPLRQLPQRRRPGAEFARSDDVNAAYQQATGVVNRDSPSQSTHGR